MSSGKTSKKPVNSGNSRTDDESRMEMTAVSALGTSDLSAFKDINSTDFNMSVVAV